MATKKTKQATKSIAPSRPVEGLIRMIRGQKVMLDRDLAELYGVETRVFNQAVRRNADRFPEDFMFQLSPEETQSLRSQFVTLEKGRGRYSKYAPLAFTEHGVAMLSSVLNSERAVQVNIMIVRAFVRMRELIASNKDLAARIEKIESKQDRTASVIEILVEDIDRLALEVRHMKTLPEPKKRRIGFHVGSRDDED